MLDSIAGVVSPAVEVTSPPDEVDASPATVGGGKGAAVDGGALVGALVGGGAAVGALVGDGAAVGEPGGGGTAVGESVGGGAVVGELVGGGAAVGEGGVAPGKVQVGNEKNWALDCKLVMVHVDTGDGPATEPLPHI